MQPIICKNCEHVFQGNFCSQCGQKSTTGRLNMHYLSDELKYTFLHINKGLLYTTKQLFTRPGHAIREYIEGKRINHYKPFLLVFVIGGINALLMHYLPEFQHLIKQGESANPKSVINEKQIIKWIMDHFTLIHLIFIPLYSFCSWIVFKKWGYNYVENLIINCFLTAQLLLYGIAIFPIQFILGSNNIPGYIIISQLLNMSAFGFFIWSYLQLYHNKDLGEVILRLLGLFVLAIISVLVLIIIGIIAGVIFVINNPEYQQLFKATN